MKTNFKNVKVILSIFSTLLLFACSSCSKDTVAPPETEIGNPDTPGEGEGEIETGEGINVDEVEKDNGELGLMVNAREITKKGYNTAFADILVEASTGNFSQVDLPIDEFTNLATLRLEIDDLTAEQEAELRDGVDLVVTVKDASKAVLEVLNFTKTSFTDSPDELIMNGEGLEDLTDVVKFRSDIPYYIQMVSEDGTVYGGPDNSFYLSNTGTDRMITVRDIDDIDYGNDTTTAYYIEEISEKPGVFSLGVRDGENKLYAYLSKGSTEGTLLIQTRRNRVINGSDTNPSDLNLTNYQFRIEKAGPGMYTISTELPTFDQNPLKLAGENSRFAIVANSPVVYFRIISLAVDWDVQELETRFTQPILPPANTDAAFNSTLRNCSSGELVQTVGQSETLTSTTFTAWEDTFSVSTTDTYSISATVSAEVEGSFFGNSATYGVEVTGGYEFSKSETTTNTKSGGLENSRSVTVSTERSITVPSQRATQVSDLYQTYRNIKVPFVQRFRIRGDFQEDGSALDGEEILTLFNFNSFSGVVTEIGSDFIEVTVRGTNTIDRLIDTRTSADNVEANCGG
ncbi:hypothetical protein [Flagellimonas eckloniae]|uniref:DUF5689 domain-containing protein n=1 Tax=Flagellimonas eckloniae TaxID=346185 RepID=A0A0Q0XEA7_9FLAO|nr:hypothetical protein [Allomuricauda eckloniae]KQC29492.1 hypothetical protein AAY42_05975 [Allomuricauda eckloniae]